MTRRLLCMTLSSLVLILMVYQSTTFLSLANTPVELTVFGLWSGSEETNFLVALENFTTETGIIANYYHYTTSDLQQIVENQLEGGTSSADIVLAPWPPWILDLASRGHLIEVTNLINASKYPTNVISSVTDDEGKIFAAPFKLSVKPGFWYKKSFFINHGLSVPSTFSEFNNTLLPAIQAISGIEQAIASGDTVGWPLSDQTEGFIMGLGGWQLQEQLITGPRQRNWTDPQVKLVFGNLTQLLEAGYFSAPAEWTSQITKFWNEQYGLYWMGGWMTSMPQILNLTDLDFFGFPETDGVAGSVDYGFIPKYAGHVDEVELLLQYLAGAEAQETMVRLGSFLAPNMDVPGDAYLPIDKKMVDFVAQPSIHIVSDLDDAIGGVFQVTFWDQLKLLWADPSTTTMNDILIALQTVALQQQGTGVWIVDDDGPAGFDTIQAAINAATRGDIVYVKIGTYHENVVLNKTLSLIGENRSTTIIDRNSTGNVINVTASSVKVTGFTVQNSIALTPEDAGIFVSSSWNNISYNIITHNYAGILFMNSTYNTVGGNKITECDHSIVLFFSSNNVIADNVMSHSEWGCVRLVNSSDNIIIQNSLTTSPVANAPGITLLNSSSNIVVKNEISDCLFGIGLILVSNNNKFHHNRFIDNVVQVLSVNETVNVWDTGYPSGGNYWSDYNGTDLCSGPLQNEGGSDGIGDTAYIVDENNQDNYPLMGMFSDFNVTSGYHVQTICNSTIDDFQFNGTAILFDVSGENDTAGFCRMCIPKALMNETYRVFVNGTEVECNPLTGISNTTHNYIYFNYTHSIQEVAIIPEFSPFLTLPLFMLATLLAVIVYKKRAKSDRFYKR